MNDLRGLRAAAGVAAVLALALTVVTSCGDDEEVPAAGGGGSTTTTGGAGGEPMGCDGCGGNEPVCVDGEECAATCPAGRAICHPDESGPTSCCATGEQCCREQDTGLPADVCRPTADGCPVMCGDGSECSGGQLCQHDPETGAFSCVDCNELRTCGAQCCPLGSQCVANSCELADLSINAPRVKASARLENRNFEVNSCVIQEGCVAAPGDRVLLRFDLETPNLGTGNLHLGDPSLQTDLFSFSPCHNHYHFDTYASYRLLDLANNEVATGHKQAFCLLDFNQYLDTASPNAFYDCSFQGIQSGWSDIYSRELDCQWVDVTDVPPGDYRLEVKVNYDHLLGESSYANNEVLVDVKIRADSCPNGSRSNDATCCADGDPCTWAGDGSCDCQGVYAWDAADCISCYAAPAESSCPGGCTDELDACCAAGDPCGKAEDGQCDCEGTQPWDGEDCTRCISTDPLCPTIDSCASGCTPSMPSDPCCDPTNDACGWANDTWCDCGGDTPWDWVDCFRCHCFP